MHINCPLQYIGDTIDKIDKDEKNVVSLDVTGEMTESEIMDLVLQRIETESPPGNKKQSSSWSRKWRRWSKG